MTSEANYFGRRAEQERAARRAHLEMASRYDDLAATVGEREKPAPSVS